MTTTGQPRLFVTGATGELGRLVIGGLLRRVPASSIVAGVRSIDHPVAQQLAAQGLDVRIADYTRPDTLQAAFQGIHRLLLISSNAVGARTQQHDNVIQAAKGAGVGLLAYTSLLHADTSPLAMGDEHRQTESLIKDSGLPSVLLRHGWYTENHVQSVPTALQYGAVMGCAGDGRFSSAARVDFADAAAVVLTSENQAGRIYELAGDESYTLADLAAVLAAAAGKPVVYRDMSKADFKAALMGFGLPDPLAELIADSDAGASKGGLLDRSAQLSTLIGRPTTPWRKTLEQAACAV